MVYYTAQETQPWALNAADLGKCELRLACRFSITIMLACKMFMQQMEFETAGLPA